MNAKTDCDLLLNATMPFAKQMLESEGAFLPFGAQMLRSGEIVAVGADTEEEDPHPSELIDLLRDSFKDGAAEDKLKATAIAFDVKVQLPETNVKTEAIAVVLDHCDDYSVKVFFPYIITGGAVSIAEPFASEGDYAIFSRAIQ